MMKIVLVQIINRNLGDGVISDCTKFLLQKIVERKKVKTYSIIPYNIYSEDFAILEKADALVFAGGGIIKYKYEKFYQYIFDIIRVAEENNIPVFFNGVGVEDFDASDERCLMLKQALNADCVKGITVRDDIRTLKENYIVNGKIRVRAVYDPALWVKETYKIEGKKKSVCIGLGIVRHKIFADNGNPQVDKEFQLQLWRDIIQYLNEKGISWKVFTNGMKSDEDFAVEVLQYAGYGACIEDYKIDRITEPQDLVNAISNFSALIACRLHANIIAYALNIPSIAFVWNEKLRFWGEKIGLSSCFLAVADINLNNAVERLEGAMDMLLKQDHKNEKRTVYRELKRFVFKYARKRKKTKYIMQDRRNCLMATALGGKNHLYAGMNTREMLNDSCRRGFRWIETDIRITTDNQLVCVNGWNKTTYTKLGFQYSEKNKRGISQKDFLKQKYYGKFPTMDVKQMFEELKVYKDVNVVLDIGKPERKRLELFMMKLKEVIPPRMQERTFIRVQRKEDVFYLERMELNCSVMYYIEDQNVCADTVAFCREHNISWISTKIEACSEALLRDLKVYGMKICVFSTDTLLRAEELWDLGVDLVSSNYLKADILDALNG